jgi:hypothetical protein
LEGSGLLYVALSDFSADRAAMPIGNIVNIGEPESGRIQRNEVQAAHMVRVLRRRGYGKNWFGPRMDLHLRK